MQVCQDVIHCKNVISILEKEIGIFFSIEIKNSHLRLFSAIFSLIVYWFAVVLGV